MPRESVDWKHVLKYAPNKAASEFDKFLDTATHRHRVQAMYELGKETLQQGTTAEKAQFILSRMRSGGFSHRFLALNACHGIRNGAHILEALEDKSATIRSMARKLIAKYADDEHALAAFSLCTRLNQKYLVKDLNKRKRFGPIDRILSQVREQDPGLFVALLPYGSGPYVEKHWSDIEDQCTTVEWNRLARNKKDFAISKLIKRAEETRELNPRLLWIVNSCLPIFGKQRMRGCLDLTKGMLQSCSLNQLSLQAVARACPTEFATMCDEHQDRVAVNFLPILPRLEGPLLVRLLTKYPQPSVLYFLKKLTPENRTLLYEQFSTAWRTASHNGALDIGIIALLPHDVRHREARLHLAMDNLAGNPQIWLRYASLLPWLEAQEVVASALGDPDAEMRGLAWQSLIGSLRYDRASIPDALSEIKKRKREQDPVRLQIATALSVLPPSIWEKQHLPDLAIIVRDALDARDLSYATSGRLEALLISLLPFHGEWAAEQLSTFWTERGMSSSSVNFERRISDEQAIKLASHIVPVLVGWKKKEYESFVIGAAQLFGRRLKATDKLVELLEKIVFRATPAHYSQSAFYLIKRNAFSHLVDLVPKMLEKDPSWGLDPAVISYLQKYRQDLLTRYLGQNRLEGRFGTGKVYVVPHLPHSMSLLSSEQLTIYEAVLNGMATNKKNRLQENFFVLNQLSRIPDCSTTMIAKYADASNSRIAERDTAILALSRLDEGQGLSLLQEALEDERASVAIYAIRKCLLKMPPQRALEIVRKTPRQGVTVFKEVVRLLGDIRSEEALNELLTLINEPLHRDVRIATLRAFWSHLDRREAWAVLNNAVDDADEGMAFTAIRTPADRLSDNGQDELVRLLLKGLKHESTRVRKKVLERCMTMPVGDPEMRLCSGIISTLGSTNMDECSASAQVLLNMYPHKAAIVFSQAVEAVLSKRRNIRTLVQLLEGTLTYGHTKFSPTAYAVIESMESDPCSLLLRIQLAVASMPWIKLANWFGDLDDANDLHADALAKAGECLLRSRRFDLDQISQFESTLYSSSSPVLRRLALYALQAQSGSNRGWTEDRLSRLNEYRKDESPFIREVAQFILPSEELVAEAAEKSLRKSKAKSQTMKYANADNRTAVSTLAVMIPSDVLAEIIDLLRKNNFITALKLYRDASGLGLKEAKDAIDALRRDMGHD